VQKEPVVEEPYDGKSPFKQYVLNKDPSIGHWITETVIKGKYTRLPYLLLIQPTFRKSENLFC